MQRVAHGIAFFSPPQEQRVLALMRNQCSAKRTAYQAIQAGSRGNYVKEAAKKDYMPLLNQRYISDAVSQASQIKKEHALFGGKKAWKDLQTGKTSCAEWQQIRNNQLYSRGDRTKNGNPNIRIAGDKLLVNDPADRGLWIEAQLFLPRKWHPDLACYSVQILYRKGKFEVNIGWEEGAPKKRRCKHGTLGLDTNPDGVALTEVDSDGNITNQQYLREQRIQYAEKDKREYDIRLLAKKVVEKALTLKKSIVLEKLSFGDGKRSVGYKKFRRMKSNFTYRKIVEAVHSRAARFGVPVAEVLPAYTSALGKLKYQKMYSLSVHNAAALVIARRGMGLLERQDFTVRAKDPENEVLNLEGRGAKIALSQKSYSWLFSGMFLKQPKQATLTGSELAAEEHPATCSSVGETPTSEPTATTGRCGGAANSERRRQRKVVVPRVKKGTLPSRYRNV
jgi:IS605 OrfB family transposase